MELQRLRAWLAYMLGQVDAAISQRTAVVEPVQEVGVDVLAILGAFAGDGVEAGQLW